MPKFGAGSEFGRDQKEEARRKKYGIILKKYNPEEQPWHLKVGSGKQAKKWESVLHSACAYGWGYDSSFVVPEDWQWQANRPKSDSVLHCACGVGVRVHSWHLTTGHDKQAHKWEGVLHSAGAYGWGGKTVHSWHLKIVVASRSGVLHLQFTCIWVGSGKWDSSSMAPEDWQWQTGPKARQCITQYVCVGWGVRPFILGTWILAVANRPKGERVYYTVWLHVGWGWCKTVHS